MRPRALPALLVAGTFVAASVASSMASASCQPAGPNAEWTIRSGPGQLAILGAAPGIDVDLLGSDGSVVASDQVDLLGSLLFRNLEPGDYSLQPESGDATDLVTVPGFNEPPAPDFYTSQQIEPGFGYLAVRDGTTLSVNVMLPGDPADGPFPTVVEYSGYDPSNPAGSGVSVAPLAVALGYARVGQHARRLQRRLVRLLRAGSGHRRVRRCRSNRRSASSIRQRATRCTRAAS